jgi:hypothetical protein
MCIPEVLFKIDTALPHSLHSRPFLDSPFVSEVRSACGNVSVTRVTLSLSYSVHLSLPADRLFRHPFEKTYCVKDITITEKVDL